MKRKRGNGKRGKKADSIEHVTYTAYSHAYLLYLYVCLSTEKREDKVAKNEGEENVPPVKRRSSNNSLEKNEKKVEERKKI